MKAALASHNNTKIFDAYATIKEFQKNGLIEEATLDRVASEEFRAEILNEFKNFKLEVKAENILLKIDLLNWLILA